MVNFNGAIVAKDNPFLDHQNLLFQQGDALLERIRYVDGKLIFWEDHYFRLMASMRMLRMPIPMNFTMELLQLEIEKLFTANEKEHSAEVVMTVFRGDAMGNSPDTEVSFVLRKQPLAQKFFVLDDSDYEVEIFKDFYLAPDLFSSLNRLDQTLSKVALIFAKENGYQDSLLVNSQKNIVQSTTGNLFVLKGNEFKTPPLTDGALNGVVRQKLLEVIPKIDGYQVVEGSISPFELQKADALFIVDDIHGIRSVTKYRKKQYTTEAAAMLLGRLNLLAKLG